jgi:hypothetical protein
MTLSLKKLLGGMAMLALVIAMSGRVTATGDWPTDSWPAIDAISHLRVGEYLSAKAMMGPVSTLVQAPFSVFAGGGSELAIYRWSVLPCLLVAAALGLCLARIAARRGASGLSQALIATLTVLNPLTVAALQAGHPEEILTAALVVGAVASAAEDRKAWSAILLGLALVSKQWAILAILPTLMALPSSRMKVGLGAAAIVAAFTLPALAASPASFMQVHDNAASAGRFITPLSAWFPFATERTEVIEVGRETFYAHVNAAPPILGTLSHPLIVVMVLALPLLVAVRRACFSLSGSGAMAMLALLALLRCALDPLDNVYYHEPLLLALIGWDAFAAKGLPLRALSGSAVAWLFLDWSEHLTNIIAFNFTYIAIVGLTAIAIAVMLWSGRENASASGGSLNFRAMKPKFRGFRKRGVWPIKGL